MTQKRSYERTSFWMFLACFLITILMDSLGLSVSQVSEYVDGVVTKTYDNMGILLVWVGPIMVAIKEYKSDQDKAKMLLEVELEKLRKHYNDSANVGRNITGSNPTDAATLPTVELRDNSH